MRRDKLRNYRLDGPEVGLGCSECPIVGQCGGYRRVGGGWSCQDRCSNCNPAECTKVCLHNQHFAEDYRELDGFQTSDIGLIFSDNGLETPPRYIPVIANGSSRRWRVGSDWVVVNLVDLLRDPISNPTVKFTTGAELREGLRLRDGTNIILSGIGPDPQIEAYWHWRKHNNLPEALAQLGIAFAISPNYSFLLEDPRTQHLFNRKRILIASRELHAAGLPAVPCLQAVCNADYEAWLDFLSGHEEISIVCMEFQTGLKIRGRGEAAIEKVAGIQEKLGRPLHLMAFGGFAYTSLIRSKFSAWTIVDSTPFVRAHKRQILSLNERGVTVSRDARELPVEEILQRNIEVRALSVERRLSHSRRPYVSPPKERAMRNHLQSSLFESPVDLLLE